VAVNSYSNSVLSLLVSNQFMELKSSVFKKFERENLFQLSFSDSIERFQLFTFIFIIGVRNLSQIGSSEVFDRVIYPLSLIYFTEIGIDSLKHAFITKFNHIPPNVYKYFKESLSNDFLSISSNNPDQSIIISRKMGFSSLPHTSLVL
jgi:transmembrane anterior posterior transformation protein 1